MKQQLSYLEYLIIIALMLKGVNLLHHPMESQNSTLAWALLLAPALWFLFHLVWRQFTVRKPQKTGLSW